MDVAHLCGVGLTVLISGSEAHLTNYALVRNGKGLNVDRRKDYDYKNLASTFVGRRMEPFMVEVPAKEVADMNFTTHRGQESFTCWKVALNSGSTIPYWSLEKAIPCILIRILLTP